MGTPVDQLSTSSNVRDEALRAGSDDCEMSAISLHCRSRGEQAWIERQSPDTTLL